MFIEDLLTIDKINVSQRKEKGSLTCVPSNLLLYSPSMLISVCSHCLNEHHL